MHIFIDESGQFIPLDGARARAAATLALIVPSSACVELRRSFRKLKRHFGAAGQEVKGSAIHESQAAQLLGLLAKFDVIVEAVVLDVGRHLSAEVTAFKGAQADKLLADITREHQPTLVQEVVALQEALRGLSNQLFLQAFCLWQLVPRVLETATMYFSQRQP